MIEDERIVRLTTHLHWFRDESQRLQVLKDKNTGVISELTDKNNKLKENRNYLESKVKSSIRQNKLLKVALERNNEQVKEANEILAEQENRKSTFGGYEEYRMDNEVNRIINKESKRSFSNRKHFNSVLHQESTDIATDENTARFSVKPTLESPNQKLSKAVSKEVIMPTQTIPESSLQNEDLNEIRESQHEETPQNKDTDFLEYVNYLLENWNNDDPEEIITEIEKNTLLENKAFEDELEDLKYETRQVNEEIRQLKKQKY